MKTETHLKYAYYLKDKYLKGCSTFGKNVFVLGCVEPDINLFSYLKGFKVKPFYGHNRDNSADFIEKVSEKLCTGEIGWFTLGRLVHYVCDAFTLPHNNDFTGGLREHTLYEKRLHSIMEKSCTQSRADLRFYNTGLGGLNVELNTLHNEYKMSSHCEENDVRFIRSAVSSVMNTWILSVENMISVSKTRIQF